MPAEITCSAPTGLVLTARLAQGTTIGASITMTESGTLPGYYTGSVPGGTAAGRYAVMVLNGTVPIGAGELRWDGAAEIVPSVASDIPTASTVAAAVRTNLSTEPARVDVAISTREAESAAATRAAAQIAEHDATQSTLASGTLQVDLRKVNGIALDGSGTPSDPWGPV